MARPHYVSYRAETWDGQVRSPASWGGITETTLPVIRKAAAVVNPMPPVSDKPAKLKPDPLPDIEWDELDEGEGTVLLFSTKGATIWAEDQPRKKVLWTLPSGDFCLYQEGLTRPCRVLWDEPPEAGATDPWNKWDWHRFKKGWQPVVRWRRGGPMVHGHRQTGDDRSGSVIAEALRVYRELPVRWQPWEAWERYGVVVERVS